jgi:hypothetical protein
MKMARKDKVMVQLGGFFDLQRCQYRLKSVSGGFGVSYKAEEQAGMWQPLSASESTSNGCGLVSRRWDWGRIVHWQAWSYCRQVTSYAQYGGREEYAFCTAARGLARARISVALTEEGKYLKIHISAATFRKLQSSNRARICGFVAPPYAVISTYEFGVCKGK